MPDQPSAAPRILEKPATPKRAGYALIVVALVLMMVITTSNALHSPLVALYCYGLILAGLALVILNKVLESRLRARLRDSIVCCLDCGWSGSGTDWYKSECCPECDGEEVILRQVTTVH